MLGEIPLSRISRGIRSTFRSRLTFPRSQPTTRTACRLRFRQLPGTDVTPVGWTLPEARGSDSGVGLQRLYRIQLPGVSADSCPERARQLGGMLLRCLAVTPSTWQADLCDPRQTPQNRNSYLKWKNRPNRCRLPSGSCYNSPSRVRTATHQVVSWPQFPANSSRSSGTRHA